MIETLIGLGILAVTQLSKSFILPKYGKTGVHVFVGILAVLVTAGQYFASHNANFAAILEQAGILLVAVVGTYEVIFSKIGNSINMLS